jgi:ergothioneine biosynthesis protein EgtB
VNAPASPPTPRPDAGRYHAIRRATGALAEPLSAEDCALQSMPDASPVKWHLAHTSWFFETFVLRPSLPGYRARDPLYEQLFNSYYQSVGEPYPRPRRGLLSRPGLAEVHDYRAHVDEAMDRLLARGADPPTSEVIELGLQHEQQHQELILTDVKHLLSCNPLRPVYRPAPPSAGAAPVSSERRGDARWHAHPGGIARIGSEDPAPAGASPVAFAFDNERPRHRRLLEPFALAHRLVTNREWIAFIEDRGYASPELWLSDGFAAARAEGWTAPLYWEARDGAWRHFTLHGLLPVDLDAPVCHVSAYEADAFARWAGARLPGEDEWEVAAAPLPVRGQFVESGLLQPAATSEGAAAGAPAQLFGSVWEWTRSPYGPYPGYAPPAGALGEYNGKFMINQLVLRGGACTTPAPHVRASYRNFFPPAARWQTSGVRLARDAR